VAVGIGFRRPSDAVGLAGRGVRLLAGGAAIDAQELVPGGRAGAPGFADQLAAVGLAMAEAAVGPGDGPPTAGS
jgi:hypothetical protein